MMDSGGVADSDDDLAGFLADLKQRYQIGDAPAEAGREPAAGPQQAPAATGGAEATRTAAGSPARTSASDAAILGLHPAFRGIGATPLSPSAGIASSPSLSPRPQESAARSVLPAAASGSASCLTPLPGAGEPAGRGAAPEGGVPTDLTIAGGGIAAAGTPGTTAAWAAGKAGGRPAGRAPAVLAAPPGATPGPQAAELQRQSSGSAAGSPPSVKRPLLGALQQAADAASGADAADSPTPQRPAPEGSPAPPAPAAQHAQPVAPASPASSFDSGTGGSPSPSRFKRNVSFRKQQAEEEEQRLPARQQAAQAQELVSAPAPAGRAAAEAAVRAEAGSPGSSMWRKGSASPVRGVLKHEQQQQQQHRRRQSASPTGLTASEQSATAGLPAASLEPAPDAVATAAEGGAASGAPAAAAADWLQLSSQLSMAGFGPLALRHQAAPGAISASATGLQQLETVPELAPLHDTLLRVLREYQRRDALMSQLLADLDERRRESARGLTEQSRLERQRDEALRACERAKAELEDVRAREVPALEARHKEAANKGSSEAARLKHALREAEAAAATAAAAAAGDSAQAALAQQLQGAAKERERLSLECERLASELARQKPYVRDLERAAASARAAARQAGDQAGLLERQLRELKQQQEQEVAAMSAELAKARHTMREAEQQLAALRAEAASGGDSALELRRQLDAERAQHDEQQAHLLSELQKLRQQLLQLQSAAAKAEAAAKADSSAAAYSSRQLATQGKQQRAEAARLAAELKQARDASQLAAGRLQAAEAAATEQLAAATKAAAAALEQEGRAAALEQELEKQRSSSRQVQQHLGQQLLDARKALAESQQQLASSQGELRRLRAAVALADAGAAAGAPAGAAPEPAPGAAAPPAAAGPKPPGTARAAAEAPAPAGGDLAAALARAVRAEGALADAEASLVGLRYRALQLEAAVSRRDKELQSLRDRLADKVAREERRLARDREAHSRIRRAYAAAGPQPAGSGAGGAASRRGAAGAVAAAARELRPVELVGLYEEQKEALAGELAAAKAEVRVLSGQLRDAQNVLISKDRAAAAAAAAAAAGSGLKGGATQPGGQGDLGGGATAQHVAAAELQREVCSVRAEAAGALREAAKQLAASEAAAARLREDKQSLLEELSLRPTLAQHRELQREADALQRQLARLRLGDGGAGAVWGGDSVPDVGRGGATAGAWAGAGRFGRARSQGKGHSLAHPGLEDVSECPRDALAAVVQDMCVLLGVRDAALLAPSMRKLVAVVGAIPRLEEFVAQVCELCFQRGSEFLPAAAQASMNPGAVPLVLEHWLELLEATSGAGLDQAQVAAAPL